VTFAAEGDTTEETESTAPSSESDSAEGKPIIIADSGHVRGFFPLTVSEQEIDATFIADELGTQNGKVLILHDRDQSIDHTGIVHLLRTQLAQAGWSTMTVALRFDTSASIFLADDSEDEAQTTEDATGTETEMDTASDTQEETTTSADSPAEADTPVDTTSSDNEQEEASTEQEKPPLIVSNEARIAAALSYLTDKQANGPVILIGIGESAAMANANVAMVNTDTGLVWINPIMSLEPVPTVKAMLDVVASIPGQIDLTAVERSAKMKRQSVSNYAQRKVLTSTNEFYGSERYVISIVKGWLYRHFVIKDEN